MSRKRLARGLAAVDVVTFVVASLVDPRPDYGAIMLHVVGITSFVVVGALLIDRVPTNPIGVLLLAAGTASVASTLISVYASLGAVPTPSWPAIELARRVGDASFLYPIAIALIGVPLVFPDGRLPSPRFRWVVAITIANQVAWTMGALSPTGDPSSADNTYVGLIEIFVLFSTLVAFGGAATAVAIRYRRGGLVQREQIKWLASVVCVAAAIIPAGFLLNNAAPDLSNLLVNAGIVALFALPIVIGIAILRYRLYEIDRIISRTIAYAPGHGASCAGLRRDRSSCSRPGLSAGHPGDTIAVGDLHAGRLRALPAVRRRVQRAVDRRFDRARYDAERTSAAFAERLRGEMDIDAVTTDLRDTVQTAIKPADLGLWLRETGR